MHRFAHLLISVVALLTIIGCASPAATSTATPAPTSAPPAVQPTATSPPAAATNIPTSPTSIPTIAPTTAPPTSAAKGGWSQIVAANNGPSPRYDHTALADPVRQQLIVFGGRGSGTFGDTWVFDFATRMWREVKGQGPAPRFGHAVVYDAASRRMLLVMGEGASFFNDVWAFDLDKETWSQIIASAVDDKAPRPRYGQSAILDGQGRIVISHGFSDQGRFDDTWAFEPGNGKWANLTPSSGARPLKRCLHELVYDAAGDRMVMFGGCSSGFGPCPQGDLWSFDLKSNVWTELKPTGATPSARSNPSLVYDSANKKIFLFGGKTADGASAEWWSYDLAGKQWLRLDVAGAAAPDARSSHDATYDAKSGRVIIFGGQRSGGASADLWELKF